jgi:hypothetical protein
MPPTTLLTLLCAMAGPLAPGFRTTAAFTLNDALRLAASSTEAPQALVRLVERLVPQPSLASRGPLAQLALVGLLTRLALVLAGALRTLPQGRALGQVLADQAHAVGLPGTAGWALVAPDLWTLTGPQAEAEARSALGHLLEAMAVLVPQAQPRAQAGPTERPPAPSSSGLWPAQGGAR